jgi:hypothetical protein
MSNCLESEIVYDRSSEGMPALHVYPLAEITESIVRGILNLQEAAYTASLVQHGLVSDKDIADHFGPTDANIERQTEEMAASITDGSQYLLASFTSDHNKALYGNEDLGGAVGLAKTTGSRPRWQRLPVIRDLTDAHAYLDTVVAGRTEIGVGSALVHAVVTHAGYKPDRVLALHQYDGNGRANAWFDQLGLELVPGSPKQTKQIGSKTLELSLRSSEAPGISLAQIGKALEAKRAWLAEGKPA